MTTLILLTVLGGKLDDPDPQASAPTVTHKLDDPSGWPPRDLPVAMKPDEPEPTGGIAPHVDPKPEPLPVAPVKPEPPKPPAMSRPRVQPPTTYLLKDATNKVWSSPDPVWLRQWVSRVNAGLAPRYSVQYPIQYGYGSTCAGGACGR